MTTDSLTTTLEVQHSTADEAFLTGDFNRWSVPGVRMHQTRPGIWDVAVPNQWSKGRFACAILAHGRVVEIVTVSLDSKSSEQSPLSRRVPERPQSDWIEAEIILA